MLFFYMNLIFLNSWFLYVLTHLQKSLNKSFSYSNIIKIWFCIKVKMKYFFEVLEPINIAAKNGLSISNSFCTGPCKKFVPFSISIFEFCKNLQKFDCFATFRCIWAYLIMKILKNSKFDTYWLTLVYSVQRCMLLTILVYIKSAWTWSIAGTQS